MLSRWLNRALPARFPAPGVRLGGYGLGVGGSTLTLSLPFQLLKWCEGTVTLDQVRGNFDITCNNVSVPSVQWELPWGWGTVFGPMTRCPIQGRERPSYPAPSLPEPQVSRPGCVSLRAVVLYWGPHPQNLSERQIISPIQIN